LTYRNPDGRAAGVVVIESRSGLLHARHKASLAGADRGLEFASGHRLDQESAGQIPGEHDWQVSRSSEAARDASQEEAARAIGATADG
jgi:hypothetical protein